MVADSLTSNDWSVIRTTFDDLVERSAQAREATLRASSLSAALQSEVRALLAAADAAGGFLEQPTATLPCDVAPLDFAYSSLRPGAVVGAFRIERLIGRGGHGEVYLARRADGAFDQTVALKLLRPEAVAFHERFRQERQILAGLEHPGVARLIDGGAAPDGRPYIAMEFVEGEQITKYCRRRGLRVEGRLALFQQVCAAAAYAHRHLVVHRDIKPGNILVTADGQPKLLDFGVARLLVNDDVGDQTVAALTPQYAAPEQFEGRRPTTATDVYALGAVLFELLADEPAWTAVGPLSAIQRMASDDARLVSSALTRKKGGVVTQSDVRGDLDSIVSKAMRKDPDQRYDGATALIADIDRHRAFLPVAARKGRWSYRTRRFLRRHRGRLAAAAAVLVVATGGALSYAAQARRVEAARQAAQIEAARAGAVHDYVMLSLRAEAHAASDGVANAKKTLDRAATTLTQESAGADAPSPSQSALLRAMGEVRMEIGDLSAAQGLFETAAALARRRDDRVGAAEADQALAAVAIGRGDLDQAERRLALARSVWASDRERHARRIVETAGVEAALLRARGRRDKAIGLLVAAVPQSRAMLGEKDEETARLLSNLAVHLIESGRVDEAASALDEAWRGLAAEGRTLSATAFAVQDQLAAVALRRGATDDAERLWRAAIAKQKATYGPSMALASMQLNLARLLLGKGEAAAALDLIEEATPIVQTFSGAHSAAGVMLRQSRALALATIERLEEARADAGEALADAEQVYGAQSVYFGLALLTRAQVAAIAGEPSSARADLDRARRVLVDAGAAGEPHLLAVKALERALTEGGGAGRD